MCSMLSVLLWLAQPVGLVESQLEVSTIVGPFAASRPNPYDRGNCYHFKGCRGESIGSMWIESPEFCGAYGGRSWKDEEGRCIDLPEGPWSTGE